MKQKQQKNFLVPKQSKAWHFERILKPDDRQVGRYVLIQPGAEDVAKVLKAYAHHPVTGFNIVSIEITYNEALNRQFFSNMKLLDVRKNNPKYQPVWQNQTVDQDKMLREKTNQILKQFSSDHHDPAYPKVQLLPMWHGTSDDVSGHILEGGYGIFYDSEFTTDDGFFGKGIYTAHEAEYAFRSYAKKHGNQAVLLLNWVSVFEAYPVIEGDMPKLKGKPMGFDRCDAHFIPVRSDAHPHTDIYYPCGFGESPDYHELVVFSFTQCLPRYRVKLIEHTPEHPIDEIADSFYQRGLDAVNLGQHTHVALAWEDAADAGHPGALIRLHWWYNGATGAYPAQPDALAKLAPIQSGSLNTLKKKASYRGENNTEAQFTLAWAYQHGLGCDMDLNKAVKYYWIAANQGHPDAAFQLAVCCASGIGVTMDLSQAIGFYEQAATQENRRAHEILAQCYAFGLGVQADPKKSETHKQAAQKGKQIPKGLPASPAPVPRPDPKLEEEIKRLKQQMSDQEAKFKQEIENLKQELTASKNREQVLSKSLQKVKKYDSPSPNHPNPSGLHTYTPALFQPTPKTIITPMSETEQVAKTAEAIISKHKIDSKTVQTLFDWAAKGWLPEIEKMLKQNSNLGLCTGTVTDLSGRQFKGITVLQYAAWCLDREMCDLIMSFMDKDTISLQLRALYTDPNRYSPYGDHYDITPLYTKTKLLIDNYSSWGDSKSDNYWVKEVGGEQRQLPAWIVNLWCEKGSKAKWTVPFKDHQSVMAPRVIDNLWHTSDTYILGKDFAWARGISSSDEWALLSKCMPCYRTPIQEMWFTHDKNQQEVLGQIGKSYLLGLKSLSKGDGATLKTTTNLVK